MKTVESRQISDFFAYAQSLTSETFDGWLQPTNLAQKNRRIFQGFEIVDSLDQGVVPGVEVSLVAIKEPGKYPQHVHQNSDAFFVITSGSAIFLSGRLRRPVQVGDRLSIPRGTAHGFELSEGEALQFISFQSPPIRDVSTGEEDFKLVDLI